MFKTLGNFDQAYSEPCHSQSSLFRQYSTIFRDIQNLVKRLHTQKSGIFAILEYSEQFHNCIPTHTQKTHTHTRCYVYENR